MTTIAVGYEIDFTSVKEDLAKILDETEVENMSFTTLSGVWYGTQLQLGLADVKKKENEMKAWFAKRKNKSYDGFIKKLWLTKKKKFIVAEVSIDGSPIYSFLYNKDGIPTTNVKKAINSKADGFISIDIERKTVACRAYIHDQDGIRFT